MNKPNFSTRLKKLRLEKGLTLQQLSEKSDISLDAISKYELGKRNPTMNVVVKLAKALDVTLEYISGGDVTFDEKKSYVDQILQKYDLAVPFMNVNKMSSEDLAKFESDIVMMLKLLKERYDLENK